jgi:hypothetical protein
MIAVSPRSPPELVYKQHLEEFPTESDEISARIGPLPDIYCTFTYMSTKTCSLSINVWLIKANLVVKIIQNLDISQLPQEASTKYFLLSKVPTVLLFNLYELSCEKYAETHAIFLLYLPHYMLLKFCNSQRREIFYLRFLLNAQSHEMGKQLLSCSFER